MEAIILAGGLGTRLRQAVHDLPKPMAPIGERPFLKILLLLLLKKGFQRVILSVGFMAHKISEYFGNNFEGMELVYVFEDAPLGTGGAARLSLEACSQRHIFIFNGDTYLDADFQLIENQWLRGECSTVVGKMMSDTFRYGRLLVDGVKVIGFQDRGIIGSGIINAGCYVLACDELKQYPLGKAFSIESLYLTNQARNGKLEVFLTDGLFVDIGVPHDYQLAQYLLINRP